MKNKSEILEIIQAMKPELEINYNVKSIGIFGSVVREKAGRRSDIDVLVEFERPIGLFKFLELEELLSSVIGLEARWTWFRRRRLSRKSDVPFLRRWCW